MGLENVNRDYLDPDLLEDGELVNKNDPAKKIRKAIDEPSRHHTVKDNVGAGGFANPEQYASDAPDPLEQIIAKEENGEFGLNADKLAEEIIDKHNFDINFLGGETERLLKKIKDYFAIQEVIDWNFQRIRKYKKELKETEGQSDQENSIDKLKDKLEHAQEQYKKYREEIAGYQIDRDPELIKDPKNVGEFVRKYNFGSLKKEHREYLEKQIDEMLKQMQEAKKTKVLTGEIGEVAEDGLNDSDKDKQENGDEYNVAA